MPTDRYNALRQALEGVLRPLVRVLIRSGVSFAEFAEVAKRLFVELAMRDMQIPGRKASVSRAAVLTGLSRKEVQRTLRESESQQAPGEQRNRAARVIEGWLNDPRFLDRDGRPRVLPATGDETSFAELVQQYGADVPPRAILDELVRVGAASVDAEGRVVLTDRRYVARDSLARLEALDISPLLDALDVDSADGRGRRAGDGGMPTSRPGNGGQTSAKPTGGV